MSKRRSDIPLSPRPKKGLYDAGEGPSGATIDTQSPRPKEGLYDAGNQSLEGPSGATIDTQSDPMKLDKENLCIEGKSVVNIT